MYICKDCGEVFYEPIIKRENLGFSEQPYWEEYDICPHCRSDEVYEAEQCSRCGERFKKSDIEHGLCDKCRAVITNELRVLMLNTFQPNEVEFLKEAEW